MRHPRVMHWDDERDIGNSLIITTARGWAFQASPDENVALHVKGFDTTKEAQSSLKKLQPCQCARCRQVTEANL